MQAHRGFESHPLRHQSGGSGLRLAPVQLAPSLGKAGLELGLSPYLGLELVKDLPSAVAECSHDRRVTPSPLDAVGDSNHLYLELHSAIVHAFVPQRPFHAPFARAVPSYSRPFLMRLLRVSIFLLDEIS